MAWWSRGRGNAEPPVPAAAVEGPPGWRSHPPLQRVVLATSPVAATDGFSAALATWRNPSFLRPLSHTVDADGPFGSVDGLVEVAGSRIPASGDELPVRPGRPAGRPIQRISARRAVGPPDGATGGADVSPPVSTIADPVAQAADPVAQAADRAVPVEPTALAPGLPLHDEPSWQLDPIPATVATGSTSYVSAASVTVPHLELPVARSPESGSAVVTPGSEQDGAQDSEANPAEVLDRAGGSTQQAPLLPAFEDSPVVEPLVQRTADAHIPRHPAAGHEPVASSAPDADSVSAEAAESNPSAPAVAELGSLPDAPADATPQVLNRSLNSSDPAGGATDTAQLLGDSPLNERLSTGHRKPADAAPDPLPVLDRPASDSPPFTVARAADASSATAAMVPAASAVTDAAPVQPATLVAPPGVVTVQRTSTDTAGDVPSTEVTAAASTTPSPPRIGLGAPLDALPVLAQRPASDADLNRQGWTEPAQPELTPPPFAQPESDRLNLTHPDSPADSARSATLLGSPDLRPSASGLPSRLPSIEPARGPSPPAGELPLAGQLDAPPTAVQRSGPTQAVPPTPPAITVPLLGGSRPREPWSEASNGPQRDAARPVQRVQASPTRPSPSQPGLAAPEEYSLAVTEVDTMPAGSGSGSGSGSLPPPLPPAYPTSAFDPVPISRVVAGDSRSVAEDPGSVAAAAGIATRDADGSYVFAPPADAVATPTESVQRVGEPAPIAQRSDVPVAPVTTDASGPAAPGPGAAAGAASHTDIEELARRLLDPLSAHLKAELRLDRERAGLVTDLRR